MSLKIKRHLQKCYPQIHDELERAVTIPRIRKRDGYVLPEAIVRVIIGQMLSGKAADTIYSRVKSAAIAAGLRGSWLLDFHTLRICGLSGAKANAVVELSQKVGSDPAVLDFWFCLSPADLIAEVKSFRGMGAWSAGILALFYVGHEDIFPEGDGTLKRAIQLIAQKSNNGVGSVIDDKLAAPYRSYLALYLWHLLDAGILIEETKGRDD